MYNFKIPLPHTHIHTLITPPTLSCIISLLIHSFSHSLKVEVSYKPMSFMIMSHSILVPKADIHIFIPLLLSNSVRATPYKKLSWEFLEQVRFKMDYKATETSYSFESLDLARMGILLSRQQVTKVLSRLCRCTI